LERAAWQRGAGAKRFCNNERVSIERVKRDIEGREMVIER
jgi:hypothetical protein